MTRQALYCTIVLSSRLKITAGEEGFSSEAGPFSVLAAEALTAPTTAPYGASQPVARSQQQRRLCLGYVNYVYVYVCTGIRIPKARLCVIAPEE